MKNNFKLIAALVILCTFSNALAQPAHSLQIDDGSSHYSVIKGSGVGGTYTLPAGGGTILTSTALSFADFYALMPGDNAATIAVNTAVQFPQNGPSDGSGSISRTGASTFNLAAVGTYEITFNVSVTEPGQLMLRLNGATIAYSVVGRATGTSQITGTCLITTAGANSILEVINPPGNPSALTITPTAGGFQAVSAHLVIKRIQ